MSHNNNELVEKFRELQNRLKHGGDGTREAENWNEFVKKYPKDLVFRISSEQIDTINCFHSHGWKFPFKVVLLGKFMSVNFQNSKFENGIECVEAEFLECIFRMAEFSETANFSRASFPDKSSFDGSIFEKDAYFLMSKFSGEITFRRSRFRGDGIFAGIRFDQKVTNSILMDNVEFGKKTWLNNFEATPDVYRGFLNNLSLNTASFDGPTIIDFKFDTCPDFSKSYFLKKFFIEETWKIDEKKISAKDEPKFRFLKKYFAEQGNHFKEQQYFYYEMMAREKMLKNKVENSADFCLWVKNLSEFLLFFSYKVTSNFGMSWVRPLIFLGFSALIMWYCRENISFSDAILKTISPLSNPREFEGILSFKIHCLFNTVLIFLFGLGIRNKFKIK